MEIYERIIQLLDGTKESDYRLDIKIGLGKNSICRWRQGQSKPSLDACMKIADYFGMSLDELVGRAEPSKDEYDMYFSQNKKELTPLLEQWKLLDEFQRAKVMAYLEGMTNASNESAKNIKKRA